MKGIYWLNVAPAYMLPPFGVIKPVIDSKMKNITEAERKAGNAAGIFFLVFNSIYSLISGF